MSEPILGFPNQLTILRMICAPVFVALTHMGVTGFDGSGNATGPLIDFANAVGHFDVILGDHTDVQYQGIHNGARLFVKDEAANMAGSFKDRRASVSIHVAKEKGYEGVSLRQITSAAGSANNSAVHYYFKSKDTIIVTGLVITPSAADSVGVARPV